MIGSDSPSALLDGLPMLRELAEKSPHDLADEWQTYVGALEGLEKALEGGGEALGLRGRQAAGRSQHTDQQAIAEAASQMGTEEVVEPASGIEQEARDVCKVNLGL